MLRELLIRDFATIAEVAVEFGPGFNVLTGETGAGRIRPASLVPTPEARMTAARSAAAIACISSSAPRTVRMPSATFAPTPCTVVRRRNQSRSVTSPNPYRWM